MIDDLPVLFQPSADAIRLHEELLLTPIGETITYARLSDALGKPVSSKTSALRTARGIALREDKAVFGSVRIIGLRRLDDGGVVDLCSVETRHVRNHAKRVGHKLGTADFTALKESARMRACALASVLAVVTDLARAASITRVAKAAGGSSTELPIRDTLRALGLTP